MATKTNIWAQDDKYKPWETAVKVIVALIALPFAIVLSPFAIALLIAFKIYEVVYYKSEKFLAIKEQISNYTKDCNELNEHIESLKSGHIGFDQTVYGHSDYHDNSKWSFKRSEFSKHTNEAHVCNCSREVCDNSRKQPLKYVCKYFDIDANEENLEQFENMLNNFEAVEEGKILVKNERDSILESVSSEIPWVIRKFGSKKLAKKLGFEEIDLGDTYFPVYEFRYVSSGGNASTINTVVMDISNLNDIVEYLNSRIKWRKSIAGQRALMTSKLRNEILDRDNHTCKMCGASTTQEPNLLLEVDHIKPLSKGGMTTEDNLQTLCWRCNRSKGSKYIEA